MAHQRASSNEGRNVGQARLGNTQDLLSKQQEGPSRQSRALRSSSLQGGQAASELSDDPLRMSTSPSAQPTSGLYLRPLSEDPLALDSQSSSTSSSPPVGQGRLAGSNKRKRRVHASDEESDVVHLHDAARPSHRQRSDRPVASKKHRERKEVYVEIPYRALSTPQPSAVAHESYRPLSSSRTLVIRDQARGYRHWSSASASFSTTSPPLGRSRGIDRALDRQASSRAFSVDVDDDDDEPWGYNDDEQELGSSAGSHRTRARRRSLTPTLTSRKRAATHSQKSHQHRKPGWMITSRGSTNSVADEGGNEGSEGSVLDVYPIGGEEQVERSDDGTVEVDYENEDEDLLRKHRPFCEKCLRGPADEMRERARKLKRRPGRRRKKDDDEISDEELADSLEGWLECTKCVISSHWGCLAPIQQKEVLNALLDIEGPPRPREKRRRSIVIDESYTFTCARCKRSPECLVCHKEHLPGDEPVTINATQPQPDHDDQAGPSTEAIGVASSPDVMDSMEVDSIKEHDKPDFLANEADDRPLLFRCLRCRQACHYAHLKDPFGPDEEHDIQDIANHYQQPTTQDDGWQCHQCRVWVWNVDMICAWRPLPSTAQERKLGPGEKAHYKDPLPREYLVKWNDRGFRHVTWVPHAWLQIMSPQRLRKFLEKGPNLDLVTDETLAARGDEMAQPTIANIMDEEDEGHKVHPRHGLKSQWEGRGPAPEVDAESGIPQEWKTVDRVLDVYLAPPRKMRKAKDRRANRIISLSPSPGGRDDKGPETPGHPDGLEPPAEDKIGIDEWERRAGRFLNENDLDEIAPLVTWCFVKWDDLQYEQACWDTPPPVNSTLYPAFKKALGRYLAARTIDIPVLTAAQCMQRDAEAAKQREPPQSQPDCIVGGKLMQFQVEGFQWLLFKYFKRESCILADDMGLGKTIQITSLLGYLGSSELKIYPFLVIVPNSTITNWVREFEKWVPHIRVVPYYGEKASRKIISKYELYHMGMQGKADGLKAHVVLTTYDVITGGDFRVFSSVPRWEALVVDEGQRLKSDSNLIFNRLKTLNTVHRILLTGTPLNNNLRELFNLLNFLDPDTFGRLADLEARFETLNESLIQELHAMIRPYILRRIKADVLKLPPKIEIIVPISLAPLQKNVYKSILERNGDVLKAISDAKQRKAKRANLDISGGGEAIVENNVGGKEFAGDGQPEPEVNGKSTKEASDETLQSLVPTNGQQGGSEPNGIAKGEHVAVNVNATEEATGVSLNQTATVTD